MRHVNALERDRQPRRRLHDHRRVDPVVDEVLRAVVAIGALLLLMVPAARGTHPMLGWLPLWLLVMPLSAWWAAHGFPVPGRRHRAEAADGPARPRRRAVQALRRVRPRAPFRAQRAVA